VNERLYRSRHERIIGGVCGGLAERFDLDPSIVRVGWALLTIVSGGVFLVIYAVMLFIVPEAPESGVARPFETAGPPGTGAVPGWQPPTSADGPTFGSTAGAAAAGSAASGAGPDPGAGAGETGSTDRAVEPAPWAAAAPPPPGPAPAGQRDHTAGLIVGLLLILGGAFLLFQQFVPTFDLDRFWPLAVVAVGVVLLVLAVRPDRRG
jgi:phage shock protein PspC (stress-responsive transcriptional regulator)